jgi:hypothetical protein
MWFIIIFRIWVGPKSTLHNRLIQLISHVNTLFRSYHTQCGTLNTSLYPKLDISSMTQVVRYQVVKWILDRFRYQLRIWIGLNSTQQIWLVKWEMAPTYKHFSCHISYIVRLGTTLKVNRCFYNYKITKL